MSTPTWLKRACAICVATVRCQIRVYRRSWSRSRAAATRSGVRSAEVGRIASCASCALRDLAERGLGDRERVGPHVGDQPDRALAGQVHSFIEALRERHRLPGAEPELAGRLLLQRGGLERGPWPLLA